MKLGLVRLFVFYNFNFNPLQYGFLQQSLLVLLKANTEIHNRKYNVLVLVLVLVLSQNLWICYSLCSKEHKVLYRWFFELIPNIKSLSSACKLPSTCSAPTTMFTNPANEVNTRNYPRSISSAKRFTFHL